MRGDRRRRPAYGALVAMALGLSACTGTEHTVFSHLDPPVLPILPEVDGGTAEPPSDAGAPATGDAGARQDSGPVDDPDLDRSVTFDWEETLPGLGTCKAGSYAGWFTCAIQQTEPGGIGPPPPISGQVSFRLGELNEEQVLSVTEGAIKDLTGILFSASLRGSLRCDDDAFDATSMEGVILIPPGTFEASLDGTFDDQALVIEGQFVRVTDLGERCIGEFHVSASP